MGCIKHEYSPGDGSRVTEWPAVCNCAGLPNEANARLIAAAPELYEALAIIIANARLIPDPATGESTDCYAVPIDDIRAAENAFGQVSA